MPIVETVDSHRRRVCVAVRSPLVGSRAELLAPDNVLGEHPSRRVVEALLAIDHAVRVEQMARKATLLGWLLAHPTNPEDTRGAMMQFGRELRDLACGLRATCGPLLTADVFAPTVDGSRYLVSVAGMPIDPASHTETTNLYRKAALGAEREYSRLREADEPFSVAFNEIADAGGKVPA